MRLLTVFCLASLVSAPCATAGQTKISPSTPGVEAAPIWTRALQVPDGRTFVSDGALALDVALAKPAKMPETNLGAQSGAIIARAFTGEHQEEVGLSDLGTGPFKNTFATPKGTVLNGNYVKFLRGVDSAARLRLRVKGEMQPIAIFLDGQPVGVVMAVRR
jgi:hypothetical protein